MLFRGPAGWAEFSPFLDYDAAECAAWLAAAREAAEIGWPAAVRTHIPVNVTVPAVGPEPAAAIVRGSGGCRTAKVKVAEPGQRLSDDLGRVEAVRDALGPAGKIRLDVNGAWDLDEAARHIRRLAAFDLEYVEQPVGSAADMARLRRLVDVRTAATRHDSTSSASAEATIRTSPGTSVTRQVRTGAALIGLPQPAEMTGHSLLSPQSRAAILAVPHPAASVSA